MLVRSFAVAFALTALSALGAGCSLGDIAHDDCTKDAQCFAAFGVGSTCAAGYCTDVATCVTGADCRKKAGGGACVNSACVVKFPIDPTCSRAVTEPPDLLTQPAAGPGAPLVIGSIYSLDGVKDQSLMTAVRLAVREINDKGGLNGGQKAGVVFCDNGGPGNTTTTDAQRIPLNNHALDYLAGTLGVPLIIGPLTSSDSIRLVTHLKQMAYPTVIISASATSPDLTHIDDRLDPKDPYGLFWRTCPSDELQGKVLGTNVINSSVVGSVAAVYVNDAYGAGLATVFRATYGLNQTGAFPFEVADAADPVKLAALANAAAMTKPGGVVVIVHADETIAVLTALAATPLATKPFFFSEGSKDATTLLNPALPAALKTIIAGCQGTAPASPSGLNYETFKTNLNAQFMLDAGSVSFLAQAYDATYVGAYGIVYASGTNPKYDGLSVADGLSRLSAGTLINLAPTEWLTGKSTLSMQAKIDVEGTSGHLQFDPAVGEAPGRIEIWTPSADMKTFVTKEVVDPM